MFCPISHKLWTLRATSKPTERNELIMIPVPKPKFFERKVPSGQSEDVYFDEITRRQTHILRDAIDRVSSVKVLFYSDGIKFVKLVYPSAMDPAGILMLRSIRIVFEMIGLRPESMNFIKQEFNADNLVKALTEKPKKCPAIVTFNLTGDRSPHVMVATNAIKGVEFIHGQGPFIEALQNKWFINCKNSYRDEISEPGTVYKCSDLIAKTFF